MSWAKLPNAWLRPVVLEAEAAQDVSLDDDWDLTELPEPQKHYPLTQFAWRKDGSSSMAALMILIALSIRLNESFKGREYSPTEPRPTTVAVTYDELQRMTGFARGPVSTGVHMLEDFGAIRRVKIGRANFYDLRGVNENGNWCQVPQSLLLAGDGTLSIKALERKRTTLHALKIYLVLLTLRRRSTNTAAISWKGLMRWTGVARADVGRAIQILIAWELVMQSEAIDERREDDRSTRYRILGLKKAAVQESAVQDF